MKAAKARKSENTEKSSDECMKIMRERWKALTRIKKTWKKSNERFDENKEILEEDNDEALHVPDIWRTTRRTREQTLLKTDEVAKFMANGIKK